MGHHRTKKPKETIEVKEVEAAKEPEIPTLEPFNREVFYSINIRDLFIDILFVIFSFSISTEFFSEGGLFDSLKTWQILAMYCAVVLTLPYYLGYLYIHNSAYFSKTVMKIQLWVFILITFVVLVDLVRLTFNLEDIEEPKHDVSGFFAVFSMFLLVLGPMMCIAGGIRGYREFSKIKEDEYKFNSDNFASTGAFFIIILAIAFMIYFIGLFPDDKGGLAAVVGMFAGPFAAVIVFGIIMGFFTLLDKIGLYKPIVKLSSGLFPLFIISVLVFWSGVNLHFIHNDFANASGKIPAGSMIIAVLLSGLIPFRIITLFNPPWRISQIIIGILSMGYFFYRLAQIVY